MHLLLCIVWTCFDVIGGEGGKVEGRVSSTVKIVLVWSEPSKFISSDFLATSNKLLVFLRIDENILAV